MEKVREQEIFKTYKDVFDNSTIVTVLKLISKGALDGLESPISIGKEANIFTGIAQGQRVAVKIYRIATCDFRKMYQYLQADPRYHPDKNRRRVVLTWAQREFRNLLKAREAGVRVPTPRAVMNNVLVMEFIGDDGQPALRLKDDIPEDLEGFFRKVIANMRKLHQAGLVHTDLSHFNILNHRGEPVFIDLSQATVLENPNAQEYLARDIKNICAFFRKQGLQADEEAVRKQITGGTAVRKQRLNTFS